MESLRVEYDGVYDDDDSHDDGPSMMMLKGVRGRREGRMAFFMEPWPTPPCSRATVILSLSALVIGILMGIVFHKSGNTVPCTMDAMDDMDTMGMPPAPPPSVPAAAPPKSPEASRDFKGRPFQVASSGGAVASDVGDCSEVGARIIRELGGNAVDAAVAVGICIGVVNPSSSGLFGGSFMVVRMKKEDGELVEEMIDMREAAPGAANETMYLADGVSSRMGATAVAVPCELKGLHLAWQRHGSAAWAELVRPSIELARGFAVCPYLAHSLQSSWEVLKEDEQIRAVFGGADGQPLRVGEIARNERQAATLELIASQGPDALYSEEAATRIAAEIQAKGGIITKDDWMRSAPVIREVAKATDVMGFDIITAPPPSSGALNVLMLRVLDRLADLGPPQPSSGAMGVHRIAEAMKHAFALRMSLSDPYNATGAQFSGSDLCEEVLEKLLDPAYALEVSTAFDAGATLALSEYGGSYSPLEDHGTAAFSVIDELGNAVSVTSTVNWGFGAKFMSASTGIVMNNEMDDFSTPGQSNGFGLAPSEANYIEPFKRPLSSMSPTIITRGGEVVATVGASGGPRIITAVLQTLVRLLMYGDGPLDALTASRIHHQFLPNIVDYGMLIVLCHFTHVSPAMMRPLPSSHFIAHSHSLPFSLHLHITGTSPAAWMASSDAQNPSFFSAPTPAGRGPSPPRTCRA